MDAELEPLKRRWRPRFSLLTLLLGVVFVGACGGLWWRWEPWHRSGHVPDDISHSSSDSESVVLLERLDGLYQLYDLEKGECGTAFRFDAEPSCTVISTRNERFLSVLPKDALSVHDLRTGKRLTQVGLSIGENAWMCAGWLGDGGRTLVTHIQMQRKVGTELETIDQLAGWNVDDGTCLYRFSFLDAEDFSQPFIQLEPYGFLDLHFLPTVSPAHAWLLLSKSGQVLNFLLETRSGRATMSLAMPPPSERTLYVGHHRDYKTLELRDALHPDYAKRFDLNPVTARPAWTWLSPDGSRLLVTTGKLCLFDVESGKKLAQCEGDIVFAETWDSSSSVFATDRPVAVWDGRTCGRICRLGSGNVEADRVRFVDGHRRLLTEVKEQTAIWDALDGSLLWEFPGKRTTFRYVSEAGNRMVTTKGEIWTRRRPEWLWGIAWLPESWVALVSGLGLVAMAVRRLRRWSS